MDAGMEAVNRPEVETRKLSLGLFFARRESGASPTFRKWGEPDFAF